MSSNSLKPIGVIADDFTGAVDAGVEFVRAGLETMLVIEPRSGHSAPVEVVSTNSRDGDVATARERMAAAATQMRGRRLFKKIDSTMRGHLREEIMTMLTVLGQPKALVCPTAIEAGRTVRDGKLWVHDRPLHESDFARDPRWPATTANMGELIGSGTTHLPLATVRAGANPLAEAITQAPTPIITVDACDQADLEIISQAVLLTDTIPCGALGLARAWAACQTGKTQAISGRMHPRGSGPILVVAGSRHPRTRAQVSTLAATNSVGVIEASLNNDEWHQQAEQAIAMLSAGRPTVIHAPLAQISEPAAQRMLLEALGDLTLRVCGALRLGRLVLTGGETASAISQRLGVAGVHILGELEVGMPWGTLVGGIAADCLVVTKAGGFGSEDALVHAVESANQPSA